MAKKPYEYHGGAKGGRSTPEHRAYQNMRNRCENPNYRMWHRYGGRGIQVAPEWRESFAAFLEEVGPRPSTRHTLDRIDCNGHYGPGNVRWALMTQQNRNRCNNKLTEEDARWIRMWIKKGYTKTSVAKAFGVARTTVYDIASGKSWK